MRGRKQTFYIYTCCWSDSANT